MSEFTNRQIRVQVTSEISNDFEKSTAVMKNILGRLGCPACTSGFDIRLEEITSYVVNPATLEVHPVTLNVNQFGQ
jgi:hypothetical protein